MFKDDDYKKGMSLLRNVRVSIDNDPVKIGIDGINRKLSEVQDCRDVVTSVLTDAMSNKTEAKVVHEMKKTEYGMEIDRLMAEDPDVKGQKSADARKAQANVKAAQLQLEEHSAKLDLIRADGYFQTALNIYENLKASYDTISRQISTLQFQKDIGLIGSPGALSAVSKGRKLSLKETNNDA